MCAAEVARRVIEAMAEERFSFCRTRRSPTRQRKASSRTAASPDAPAARKIYGAPNQGVFGANGPICRLFLRPARHTIRAGRREFNPQASAA